MPVESKETVSWLEIDYVNLMSEEFPISLKLIKSETCNDSILSKVLLFVENGWPDTVENSFKPYFARKL
jgi:hypothetical protein